MKKIVLYNSGIIKETPLTGGIRRFLELANGLGQYCDLILISGDKEFSLKAGKHFSTKQSRVLNKEAKRAIHNYKYLKQIKKSGYDQIISFDVPPTIWLVLFGLPHICLMVRKDYIGYEKLLITHNSLFVLCELLLKFLSESIVIIKSEMIIVQCNYDKEQLKNRHIFLRKIIDRKTVIQINNVNPSWVDSNPLQSNEKALKVSRIGTINGFEDLRKGCDLFLEAASRFSADLDFYIAGDGSLLTEYIEKYKKYKNIHFVGRINDSNAFLESLDLSIVPSRADSCPNTIMESLSVGTPVIASNIGGIPEILKNEQALFEPTVDALENIIRLYRDETHLLTLSKQQLIRKKELEFNWPYMIFTLLDKE